MSDMPADQPPATIEVQPSCDNKLIVVIYMDGHVEFGPGFTASDADKAFWEQLGKSLPTKCEK